ncbi:YerC/YecD family TrpR-related protein [Gordonibacter sp. Marseille-P4307]|uniref:YerC/YecD family TrpR-related protein n=1 Tax=Gordonibacter sp. Marseille-P4307 TaxID=2161815 RepID=UPI000F52A9BD|nr:YerC/YecD family TrpR-related protein [Gordonibacter sp. Marseille-P4307]
MDDLRNEDVENLLQVLVSIDDKDCMFALLEDLFTIREIRESSQRLAVARMLDSGMSYVAIEKQTGMSATTIARVSKCLGYGAGGYRHAIEVLSDGQAPIDKNL